jgi:hypothetical protein
VTTRKHHPQQVVLDGARREELFNRGRKRPLALDQSAQLRLKGSSRTLTPEEIDGAVLGRGHEPGGWILRHATNLPHVKRTAEGVLHHIFCQCEIVRSEDARQRGDHPPRFMPE